MKIRNLTITTSGAVCAMIFAGFGAEAQNLFIASNGATSLYEFSGGTLGTFGSGLGNPSGLAFDSSGDLFEADQVSGNIYEWVGGGTTRSTFTSQLLLNPSYLAVNAAGDLFVNVNGAVIDEFNTAGSIINTISIGSSGMAGMAFDSAGNLYVADINGGAAGAGFIEKITPQGGQSTFASGLNFPNGIAFDAAGNLFVADGNANNTITEITPGGKESLFASLSNNPHDIAFYTAGDMFVAEDGIDGGNGDIAEFAANGNKGIYSTSVGDPEILAFQGVTLPVPEPSAYAFMGLGLAALVGCSLKSKKTA